MAALLSRPDAVVRKGKPPPSLLGQHVLAPATHIQASMPPARCSYTEGSALSKSPPPGVQDPGKKLCMGGPRTAWVWVRLHTGLVCTVDKWALGIEIVRSSGAELEGKEGRALYWLSVGPGRQEAHCPGDLDPSGGAE